MRPVPLPMEEKVNILVVDDLADKRLAFREVLEDLDENLILVSSGAEALRELLEREFAVIVLDVNMPDIDGIETAELIRKHGRTSHTPIIFVTAYADEMQTERGYELGAVDYILTPVVPAILRSKVRVFVDLYRAQRRAAKVARAEAGRAAGRSGAAQLGFDRAREPRARRLRSNSESSMERLLEVLVPTRRRLRGAVGRDGRPRRVRCIARIASPRARSDAGAGAAAGAARDGGSSEAAAMRSRFASTPAAAGQWPEVVAVRARAAAQGRRAQHRRPRCSVSPSHESAPLDERGLLEIATRAAIAFDNAQLYSSLEREMARAKPPRRSSRKRTGARTSSSRCCRTSCAIRSRRSSRPRKCSTRSRRTTRASRGFARSSSGRSRTSRGSSTICSTCRASRRARSRCNREAVELGKVHRAQPRDRAAARRLEAPRAVGSRARHARSGCSATSRA